MSIAPALAAKAVEIASLAAHPSNARIRDERAQAALRESLETNGQYRTVVARRLEDGTLQLLAGHGTVAAAEQLGWTHIAADVHPDLTDEAAARIVLVDNRTNDLAGYDEALLGDLLAELSDLTGSGYDLADLAALDASLAGLAGAEVAPPGPTLADRFVVPPFSVLDARQGIWQDRKRRWLALGIQSEVGRGGTLEAASYTTGADRGNGSMVDQILKSEKGRGGNLLGMSKAILRGGYHSSRQEGAEPPPGFSGVSIFDPVLCELAYRWFSAPGAAVLDPFAGGSVRGILAAALGRAYTGIELRAEQVAANEAQRTLIAPALRAVAPTGPAAMADSIPDLTPIEQHGGHYVKRDDLYSRAGQRGGKVRTCWALAAGATGLITASSRQSPQALIVANIAKALGVPCRLHMPTGERTPEMLGCEQAGAEIIQHVPGRNSVIVKRARDDAAASGHTLIPFGMEDPEAIRQTRRQAASLVELPASVTRIVVPVGSGMSLAGILHGMADVGLALPVLAVSVGADPSARLARYAPDGWQERCQMVSSGSPYEAPAATTSLGGLELDAHYEAKCLPHLRSGDLLWVVGNRAQPTQTFDPVLPAWITGDSLQLDTLLPADYRADLLFSCPPYADLEVYSDDPADISNMAYPDFLAAYRAIIAASVARLRDDRFIVWVVGEVRDKRGVYRGLVGDTVAAFTDAGCAFYNDAVLVTSVGSLPIRAGKQFSATRKLGRTHQYVLVFVKGDPRKAADAAGRVEVVMPDSWDDEA